jgi:hypothetical protein
MKSLSRSSLWAKSNKLSIVIKHSLRLDVVDMLLALQRLSKFLISDREQGPTGSFEDAKNMNG